MVRLTYVWWDEEGGDVVGEGVIDAVFSGGCLAEGEGGVVCAVHDAWFIVVSGGFVVGTVREG